MDEPKEQSMEELLKVAQPQLYRLNAFRIAELAVDARPRDISRRQREIKQARDIDLPVPPGPARALPLNEPPGLDVLEASLECLNDPERRIIDEFFWFWPQTFGASQDDEALATPARDSFWGAYEMWKQHMKQADDNGYAVHNLAVLCHASALDWEQTAHARPLTEEEQELRGFCWRAALAYWQQLLEIEEFWRQMSQHLCDLDDPRLTPDMAQQVRATLPLALLSINAQLALDAAERKDIDEAVRQITILNRSGFLGASCSIQALERVTRPLREQVKVLCQQADTRVAADPEQGDAITVELLQQTRLLLETLTILLPENNEVLDSICDEVAWQGRRCTDLFAAKTEQWSTALTLLKPLKKLAKKMLTRQFIQELVNIVEGNQVSGRSGFCWFCQQRQPDLYVVQEVRMMKNGQVILIPIPRCRKCASIHNVEGYFKALGILSGLILSVALYVAFDLLFSALGLGDFAPVLLPMFFTFAILLTIHTYRLGRSIGSRFRPQGTYSRQEASNHPTIRQRQQQGWYVTKLGV